ncbi:hypothetical protein J7L67_02060 [bacterium]|nr:hypothetical protein [bacterium]
MSYLDPFEHSFMKHTLSIIEKYKGEYGATILINCLLGLLVLPKEEFITLIPECKIADNIDQWGITFTSIESTSTSRKANLHPNTIRGFVIDLRHAIAHFNIEHVTIDNQLESEVVAFEFTNDHGFKANLKLEELRAFVTKLAQHLDRS